MSGWTDTQRYSCKWMHPDVGIFMELGAAAERFGTTPRNIMRWIESGVDWIKADEIATELGTHPTRIWPEYRLPAEAFEDMPAVEFPLFDVAGLGAEKELVS